MYSSYTFSVVHVHVCTIQKINCVVMLHSPYILTGHSACHIEGSGDD